VDKPNVHFTGICRDKMLWVFFIKKIHVENSLAIPLYLAP
jgi:hypothetical protein